MAASRTDAFGDLSEFQPRPKPAQRAGREGPNEGIDQLAQASGFPSRQPAKSSGPAPRPSARRYTTGRNQQINVKATPETIARFYRLADERKVVLGELLELALDALEQAAPAP